MRQRSEGESASAVAAAEPAPGAVAAAEPAPGALPAAAADPREARRNYRLGVLNGIFFQAGEGCIDPGTVIPLFLSRLTSSSALIGLGSAMSDMGWLVPQIFFVPHAARMPRQMGIYRNAAWVRGVGLLLIAALAWPLRDQPLALLGVFFLGYGAYSLPAGFGAVAFMEIVGRTVPHERLTPFWSARLFWGGILSAGAALLVRRALQIDDFGLRYVVLFGCAAVLVSVGYGLFAYIREPALPPRADVPGPMQLLRQGIGHLRADTVFRQLLMSRAVLNLWYTASPFMVLFAVHDLGGGRRAAGTFLVARLCGFVLGNLAWHPISARHGNRALMRAGTAATVALAFAAAALALLSPWRLGWMPGTTTVILLEVLMFFGGAAHGALNVGYASLSIELAPPGERQVFVCMLNTFLGPTMLLPAFGGAVLDRSSPPVLFALCGAAALPGARAAWALPRRAATVRHA